MQKFKPQFRRLIFIDTRVRRGDYPNCATLAREYEANARTIARDIEYMRDMLDAPIEYDQGRRGYYYTQPNYMVPAINVSESDLFALCVAEKALAQYAGTPLYSTLDAVFRKLASLLPDDTRVSPSWLGTEYSFIPDSAATIDPEVWETLAVSLRGRNAVEIEHRKAHGEITKRVVHPYHIAAFRGEWYLIAWCSRRNEVLRFAVSRIEKACVCDGRYEIPAGFDFRNFLGESFGIMDEGEPFTVRVLFNSSQSPYVQERNWHPRQEVDLRADGSLVLSFPATSLFEVKRWVLSWGADARAIEPEKLAASIKAELMKSLGSYG